jgi:hypothetical protein
MLLASGLLSAAGPQTMPVSLGQAIGASLPAAMYARDRRAEIGLRNEQFRREIERENKQQAAQTKLTEMLRASGPDGELVGLLSEVNPGAASEAMLGGLLGGGTEEPTDVRTMRAIGLPLTPDGFAQFASEWRRKGIGVISAVGGALGLDNEEMQKEITSFDTLKKNLNDQLISLMSAGTLGQATDSKLQQYRDSLASPDTAPGAVMAIQAGIAETLLDQADVLQIPVKNREQIESSIEEMRNYVPPGAETVLDVPAAADATRRAVVRAADIGRMGIEQLNALDPGQLTPELLEAARKRWDQLNAR